MWYQTKHFVQINCIGQRGCLYQQEMSSSPKQKWFVWQDLRSMKLYMPVLVLYYSNNLFFIENVFHYFTWEEKQCSSSWVDCLLSQCWKSKNASKPGEIAVCLLWEVLMSVIPRPLGPTGISYLVLLIWDHFILVDAGFNPPSQKMISFPVHVLWVELILLSSGGKNIYLMYTDPFLSSFFS